MSLQIDIKSNDAFAKSAYEAADALDKVAAKEKTVDAMAEKIGASYKQAAASARDLSAYTAVPAVAAKPSGGGGDKKSGGDKAAKAADKEAAAKKKAADAEKKKAEREKESLETLKRLPFALTAAAASAAALAAGIAYAAKSAFDAKREAAALIDAFTGKRGPEHLALLDKLATNLGASFGDVRGKFVEFRQAGLDNKLSFALIKMRADLMAVGLSAAAADKEVARVTGAADGRNNLQARRALAEISRAYRGVGDGAKAAAFAATSLEGAQNKLGNFAGEELAQLWKDIGPDIGKAAHALADFALDLAKSDEGKAALAAVRDGFKAVAEVVTNENLTTGLNVIKAIGMAIYQVFDIAGKEIAFAAVKAVEAVDWITEALGGLVDKAVEMFPSGAAIVDGLIDGITGGAKKAAAAAVDLANTIAKSFADTLGIKSPSKLFEGYGKNTVQGFERGEQAELSSAGMPLQQAAAEPVSKPGVSPQGQSQRVSAGGGGYSVTIEQLIVQGGGDAEEIGRSIRAQLQRMLQDLSLSQGVA